jgi:hypothetical protein
LQVEQVEVETKTLLVSAPVEPVVQVVTDQASWDNLRVVVVLQNLDSVLLEAQTTQ